MPEELFVAGVDPGLKQWLVMRQASRDAKLKGGNNVSVTSDIRYKLDMYWTSKFLETAGEGSTNKVTAQPIYRSGNKESKSQSKDSTSSSRLTSDQFEHILSVPEIVSQDNLVMRAMEQRNLHFLTRLLEHGININHRIGECKRTMLQLACKMGEIEKVRFLLEAGASPNILDAKGMTSLHLAIHTPSRYHDIRIIEMLLTNGCKVNVQDKKGHTPLHLACIIKNRDVVELLLRNNANPHKLDTKEMMPIDHYKDRNEFIKLAHKYTDKQLTNKMWSRVVAKTFVSSLMLLFTPNCTVCKRPLPECAKLKTTNYRYWLLAHRRLTKERYEPIFTPVPPQPSSSAPPQPSSAGTVTTAAVVSRRATADAEGVDAKASSRSPLPSRATTGSAMSSSAIMSSSSSRPSSTSTDNFPSKPSSASSAFNRSDTAGSNSSSRPNSNGMPRPTPSSRDETRLPYIGQSSSRK